MTTLVDAPTRVDGVQLIGKMVGSGYRTPPALVRRSDGQVLQLTPLLYLVLDAADGRRSCAQIAELVGRAAGRAVSEDDVRTLVDTHLRPLGLLKRADGSDPELKRSDPLFGLKPRFAVTDPRTTRRLTDPFRLLFQPVLAAVVLICFVAVVGWVFFDRGLAASAYDAFERPHLLVLVFLVSVLSGGFHEFGHAAAARYGGAEPGAMGAGLYLVWPAFYTDVTDSYRLDRSGRIRTDLGGLYFNAIVVVLTFAWWWWTGWEALLLLVATQVLQMAQQLLPLLRFDGYHLLADLAGVPDLYQRIRPTLVGLLPHRWRMPENRVLTPWARVIITFWVLVTVPMMVLMLTAVVMAVPRLAGSADAVIREDAAAVADATQRTDWLDVAGHALQVLGIVLPLVACVLILWRIGVKWFSGLSVWSRDSVWKRMTAAALSAALITGLSWAWWPHPGAYRPIQPGEEGTLSAILRTADASPAAATEMPATSGMLARPGALPVGTAARSRLSNGEPLVATFDEGTELPTKADPVLAMVLVPVDDGEVDGDTSSDVGRDAAGDQSTASSPSSPSPEAPQGESGAGTEPWVFPFDQPLPPEEGDNQALAVNTADDSITYDVTFALVWAEGDEVLNVNEAHAYASCSNCVTVAVAFQVVLIMDDAQVVVPQNLAVAANYDCYRCITAAVASQLVLSVQEEPGEEQLLALGAVWDRLLQFAQNITAYSLTEITDQLDAFKDEIVQILGGAPPVRLTTEASTSTDSPSDSATPSPTGTTSSTSTPSPSETTTTTSPTPSPTSTSSSPTPSPTPSPSPSPSPSPTESTSTPSPTSETTTASPSPSPSPSPTTTTTSPTPSPTTTSPSSPAPTTTSPSSPAPTTTSPSSPAPTTTTSGTTLPSPSPSETSTAPSTP